LPFSSRWPLNYAQVVYHSFRQARVTTERMKVQAVLLGLLLYMDTDLYSNVSSRITAGCIGMRCRFPDTHIHNSQKTTSVHVRQQKLKGQGVLFYRSGQGSRHRKRIKMKGQNEGPTLAYFRVQVHFKFCVAIRSNLESNNETALSLQRRIVPSRPKEIRCLKITDINESQRKGLGPRK